MLENVHIAEEKQNGFLFNSINTTKKSSNNSELTVEIKWLHRHIQKKIL
jgi:hypothetical protein